MSSAPFGINLLVVAHGVSSGVLAGAAIHNGWLGWCGLRRAKSPSLRLRRLYPKVIAWSFTTTFVLGLLVYPTFRVAVRAAWLDAHLPWVTALFEMKEHAMALTALLLPYLVATSRCLGREDKHVDERLVYRTGIAVAVLVSYALLVGLFVGTLRAP